MSIRVAVLGAGGRMGGATCAAVTAASGLELVRRVGRADSLDLAGVDVAVDFAIPSVTLANVLGCIRAGVHAVVGTTGWTPSALEQVRGALAENPRVGVLIAPNFAVGAILAMKFAQQAARFYESVEVIELHHPKKVDAPSGTALRTASLIAQARAEAGLGAIPDATEIDPHGARGPILTGSGFMPSGCRVWLRTKRSCSAAQGSSSASGMILLTAFLLCPGLLLEFVG